MNQQLERFIEEKLSRPEWRLDNLYTIKDKDGNKRIMKLNYAQKQLTYMFKHNRKIILKSRQQGISTYYLAYNLDKCIFVPGTEAGVQSIGLDESEKLNKRALLMWEEFDEDIKQLLGVKLVSNNSKGMTFSNGSVLKIGNFRGDTLQSLHVSELGKIAKKYPEKARELKTGAFQAVSVSNEITIESTAEGRTGLFAEMWNKAYALYQAGKELTPLDFQAIFLSWVYDQDCQMDYNYPYSQELSEYFDNIEKKLDIVLTSKQKWWYAAKYEELKDDIKQEYPTTPEEAFEQSVEGTIYRNEYIKLIKENRIGKYDPIPGLPVTVSYDLGYNDTTDLIFCQINRGVPRIFYHYQNSGENIEYYVKIMNKLAKDLKFRIQRVILPHDANVHELSTGRTRIETFRRLGVPVVLQPKVSIEDGIHATRQFLNICEIDEENCETLITAIQNYRYKFDNRLQIFLDNPVHDIHSNPCDSLKYMSLGTHFKKTLKTEQHKTINGRREFNRGKRNKSEFYDGSFAI